MSIATARSQLKTALAPLGFVQFKPNLFWARTDEVLQLVRVDKVRRIPDQIEIELGLWSPVGAVASSAAEAAERPLIRESIGDTRFTPSSWKLERFDAGHVAWRVGKVGAAFTRATDIARHYTDRYHDEWIRESLGGPVDTAQLDGISAPRICYPNATEAPSEANTNAMLRTLEAKLFNNNWEPCPGMDGHWMHEAVDDGFQYCAYLLPNSTGTLASIHYYSATSADLRGPKSHSSLLTIGRAVKNAVRDGALALQLPLFDLGPYALDTARALLREDIEEFPANAIRSPGSF